MQKEEITINIIAFEDQYLEKFAELADNDVICGTIIRISQKALQQYQMYRDHCYIAVHDDCLIGYVFGGIMCDTLYPQHLYVHPAYRRKSIGKSLMEMLERESHCNTSMIYFEKDLSKFYEEQRYLTIDYAVACKNLFVE